MFATTGYCAILFAFTFILIAKAVDETTQSSLLNLNDSNGAVTVNQRNAEDTFAICPNMIHYVFEGCPRDEAKSGIFREYSTLDDTDGNGEGSLRACVTACCENQQNSTCNVVFVFKQKCYHVSCVSNEACLPKERPQVKERLQMVLVNPVQPKDSSDDENITWQDVMKGSKNDADLYSLEDIVPGNAANRLSFWKQPHKYQLSGRSQDSSVYDEEDIPIAEKRVNQFLMQSPAEDTSNSLTPEDIPFYGTNMEPAAPGADAKYTVCDFEISEMGPQCGPKEECVPVRADAQTGICKCQRGFTRNRLHECVLQQDLDYQFLKNALRVPIMAASASEPLPIVAAQEQNDITTTSTRNEPNKKIVVSVVSKEVRLPEKEVTLSAFTVPSEQSSETTYKYLWTLITQPKGPMNGTISDQSKSKVKLSNLSEGLYTFKVSVTGDNGTYGEAMANVTVLPEKRINRVPQVVISPKVQVIRQPTTNAILDGNKSSDDDKIINWHWEVVSGPIGYQPKLAEVSTLQLTDLNSPGNYTFKLTVTDSDNMTNSTTALIVLLKEPDYPPVANAGEAVILYLPTNNVTLNGTASSDDHEIVAWEWTKDASDEAKAVDMQNTRTPYLQLSNLEEGMYTFVLKVTDGSGQFSTAEVHVFVKPPTNLPPVAAAGANSTINLPRNWVPLNGSLSTDDIRIGNYSWKQLSGPNNANIINANMSIANATGLTLGTYTFELSVMDEANNTATDLVWVKVVQEKNAPPIANAGGDKTVTLPLSALYLNGSESSDDLAVVKYSWTRDGSSLAAGTVVGDTDKQPVLILTDLVHGRYVFKLTVSDDQGLTSSDTVSINVRPDPMLVNLVELTLPMGIYSLTQSELETIMQKIGLVLGDMKVNMRELKRDTKTDASILVFYAEMIGADGKFQPVHGLSIERLLKDKLQRDASIFGEVFADVRTTVCQYNCSGHGICNDQTRACICEAFWMPSIGYFWGLDESNCDWSILYVIVAVIVTFLLLSGMFWGINCACRRQSKKPKNYSLIRDEEAPQYCRGNSLSDSETDSDVLFETRTKSNGTRMNGSVAKNKRSNGQHRYGGSKLGRKVKT